MRRIHVLAVALGIATAIASAPSLAALPPSAPGAAAATSPAASSAQPFSERHIPLMVRGAVRDMIVSGERKGRGPAVLLVGGLGCYSLAGDGPPYGGLLRGLEALGYVTARVEKTGEGASGGPPCASESADLNQEIEGYVAGLHALAELGTVDPGRIFIFAHSLGPLEAVRIAQHGRVRGVVAAETIGKGWFDYQLEIIRQQPLTLGTPYDRVERMARIYETCLHRFYVEKAASAQVAAENPACRDIAVPGVPDSYLHQVADLDLAAEWKKLDVPVLVVYGGSDPATSADESRYLVDMINSFHPGRATYLFIPGMGHALNPSPSQAQFLRDHGGSSPRLHPALLADLQSWLRAHGAQT